MSCANCLTSATRALRLFSFKKKTLYILDDVTGSSSLEGSEVDSEKEVVTNSGLIMDFLFFFFLGGGRFVLVCQFRIPVLCVIRVLSILGVGRGF